MKRPIVWDPSSEIPKGDPIDQEQRKKRRQALGNSLFGTNVTAPVQTQIKEYEDGDIFVVGAGDCGQLGKSDEYLEAKLPVMSALPDQQQVRSLAAGGVHSLAVTSNGLVYSCGVNDEGALGRRTDNKVWEQAEASLRDGQESKDDFDWGQVPLPDTHGIPLTASAGDSHSIVATDRGCLWGWGTFRDSGGVYGFQPDTRLALLPRLIYEPADPSHAIVKVCSGTDHVLGLTKAGKVLSWGTGWQGQLGRIAKQTFTQFTEAKHKYKALQTDVESIEDKIQAAAASDRASLQSQLQQAQEGAEAAKKVYKPREESLRSAQLSPTEVPLPSRVVSISCGWYNSFAVDELGVTWSFGLDNYGQASGSEPSSTNDEEERFIYEPQKVAGLLGLAVSSVAAGNHHTLALLKSGTLLSFGRTTYGRLGRLNEEFTENVANEKPSPVDGLANVKIAGLAAETGKAFLWGSGTNKQLGNAGKRAGSRNAGLSPEEFGADTSKTADESENLDEPIPWRLDVSRLQSYRVLQIEFGGQHTLILAKKQAPS